MKDTCQAASVHCISSLVLPWKVSVLRADVPALIANSSQELTACSKLWYHFKQVPVLSHVSATFLCCSSPECHILKLFFQCLTHVPDVTAKQARLQNHKQSHYFAVCTVFVSVCTQHACTPTNYSKVACVFKTLDILNTLKGDEHTFWLLWIKFG